MYGDLRYELAKLLHSVDGKYEAIINNLYCIDDTRIVFFMSEKKAECFKAAEQVIFTTAKKFGITPRELKAIEATLFLSMIPLHSENVSHQLAFKLTAKRIMEELYENRV